MSEIGKILDVFKFLLSILSHLPTEVCNYFFKCRQNNEFELCWTFAIILTPKRLKKDIGCLKTKMLKFSTHLESFWRVFQAKRWNVHFKNCKSYLVLSLWILLEIMTKTLGNSTEIASKRQKLLIFRQFLDQFRNWIHILTKTHGNNFLFVKGFNILFHEVNR